MFLEEMDRVVPWSELVTLISPFAMEVMLRIHFMQQWFNLIDPAMEEALHDMAWSRPTKPTSPAPTRASG